jgi:PAS domain S-box-containing protein
MSPVVPKTPPPDSTPYQLQLGAIPLPIFIVDSDVRIRDLNSAARQTFLLDKESVYQRRGGEVLHCLHAGDVPEGCGRGPLCSDCEIRNSVKACFEGQTILRKKVILQRTDGLQRADVEILLTVSLLPGSAEPLALLMIEDVTDITALQSTILAVMGSTEDLIFSVDLNFDLIVFNTAFQKYSESAYAVKPTPGMPIHELVPPARAALWDTFFQRALAEGSYRIELLLLDSRTLELSFSPVTKNGITTGISVFGKDITERKIAEAARATAEKQYRDIFDNATEGIYQATTDGVIRIANPAALRMLGYESKPGSPQVALPLAQAIWQDSGERERFLQLLREHGSVRDFECRFRRKNGSLLWLSMNSRLVRDEDGNALYSEGSFLDISTRKKAETALRESEENNRITFEQAAVGIAQVALNGEWLRVNDKLCDILGYPREELMQLKFHNLTHPGDISPSLDARQKLLDGIHHTETIEKRYIRKDGCVIWASLTVSLVRNDTDVPMYFITTVEDITTRKLAEEKYSKAFHASPVTVVITRLEDGGFLEVNEAFEKTFGYTRAEALGQTTIGLGLWAHLEDRGRIFSGLTLSNAIRDEEVEFRIKSGGVITCRYFADLIELDGKLCVLAVIDDITDYKRAEREVQRLNRALRVLSAVNQALTQTKDENELLRRVAHIFAEMGGYPLAWIAVASHDPEYSVRIAARAGKALGYLSDITVSWNKNELAGRGPTGIALRDGLCTVVNSYPSEGMMAPVIAAAQKYGIESNITVPLIVQDSLGMALSVYAAKNDAFSEDEVRLIMEVGENLQTGITAIRAVQQAEEERKQRETVEILLQQSQKLEAMGQLAGGIAHDFNNLLMVIMAQTEILSLSVGQKEAERAGKVIQAAHKAARLTGQLLAFSRKQPIQPTSIALNQMLTGMTDMLERLVGENIHIESHICGEPWTVIADRSQIEQVIMNLVVNARDAMPDGGHLIMETANISIDDEYIQANPMALPGEFAMLSICDTGTGMTEETQSHIFEPFYTTKDLGKGTGLGLSMVYGIVKKSGGFIVVDSHAGSGTCFKIFLPRATQQIDAPPGLPASLKAAPSRRATILLVEDEENLRSVIHEYLTEAGHKVLVAEGVAEAVRAVADYHGRIELLLTDVILRNGNGKQLADDLSDLGYVFPVVYMSGYTRNEIGHHGVLAPGTHFLQKPFSRSAILSKIQEALTVNS